MDALGPASLLPVACLDGLIVYPRELAMSAIVIFNQEY